MPKYFVWDTDYPEEGSIVVEASCEDAALAIAADDMDEQVRNLSVAEATPETLARWHEDGVGPTGAR